jgi:HD superfamily phosphodiesterase/predicted RNA-binding Zn-ribbon protein involved in translation (DUF1610 family)
MNKWRKILNTISPAIIPEIRDYIIQKEQQGAPGMHPDSNSFLWDHTLQVTAIAFNLSLEEEVDPLVPVLTALFHDAGKFSSAGYHRNDKPEEQAAANAAESLLTRLKLHPFVIAEVTKALNTLYMENTEPELAADIVHDADFLAKFGYLGAAQFFIKAALRGHNLSNSMLSSVSKELTYAAVLPENMRTPAGQKRAVTKKRNSRTYFRGLINELRETGIMDARIRIIKQRCPQNPIRQMTLHLVEPAACPQCGGSFRHTFRTESGLKCRKLNASISCTKCKYSIELSFCLPEIPC